MGNCKAEVEELMLEEEDEGAAGVDVRVVVREDEMDSIDFTRFSHMLLLLLLLLLLLRQV